MGRTLAFLVVVLIPIWGLQAQEESEVLDAAVLQVREGAFENAALALDRIARSLAETEGAKVELVKAYTYLSAAYLGLEQEDKARAAFVQALRVDPNLAISEEEFPPKFAEFFQDVAREEAAAKPEPTPATLISSGL